MTEMERQAESMRQHLDNHPGDWVVRRILADLWDDQRDSRCDGMRWMVEYKKHPYPYSPMSDLERVYKCRWWVCRYVKYATIGGDTLPYPIFQFLKPEMVLPYDMSIACRYHSMRDAEDDFLRAFQLWSAAR